MAHPCLKGSRLVVVAVEQQAVFHCIDYLCVSWLPLGWPQDSIRCFSATRWWWTSRCAICSGVASMGGRTSFPGIRRFPPDGQVHDMLVAWQPSLGPCWPCCWWYFCTHIATCYEPVDVSMQMLGRDVAKVPIEAASRDSKSSRCRWYAPSAEHIRGLSGSLTCGGIGHTLIGR